MEDVALVRAPDAEDSLVVGEDITTLSIRTNVVAVGEATCCKCISRARLDEYQYCTYLCQVSNLM